MRRDSIEETVAYKAAMARIQPMLDKEFGIVEKSGSWFSYNGGRVGQGRDNVIAYLKNTPELADEIEKLIREKMV